MTAEDRCPRDGQTREWHAVVGGTNPDGSPRTNGSFFGCDWGVTVGGCWMTFSWDMGATDVRPHPSEVAALRHVNQAGYGRAIFVPFGSTCDEAAAKEQTR